ncbi:hypothetical protein T492DRAFT_887819, partial [Pavlovales sp. CCMP2436]
VRARIAAALQLEAGTEVVLAASGVEAEYIPVAIAQQSAPFGRNPPSGTLLAGFKEVELFTVPARDAAGEQTDAAAAIMEEMGKLANAQSPGWAAWLARATGVGGNEAAWVVRQVAGSKTGDSGGS